MGNAKGACSARVCVCVCVCARACVRLTVCMCVRERNEGNAQGSFLMPLAARRSPRRSPRKSACLPPTTLERRMLVPVVGCRTHLPPATTRHLLAAASAQVLAGCAESGTPPAASLQVNRRVGYCTGCAGGRRGGAG